MDSSDGDGNRDTNGKWAATNFRKILDARIREGYFYFAFKYYIRSFVVFFFCSSNFYTRRSDSVCYIIDLVELYICVRANEVY